MPEKRTVKVNGEEFEVEIELNDDGTYEATVEGQTFSIEVPNAQAAPSNKPAPPLFIFGLTL